MSLSNKYSANINHNNHQQLLRQSIDRASFVENEDDSSNLVNNSINSNNNNNNKNSPAITNRTNTPSSIKKPLTTTTTSSTASTSTNSSKINDQYRNYTKSVKSENSELSKAKNYLKKQLELYDNNNNNNNSRVKSSTTKVMNTKPSVSNNIATKTKPNIQPRSANTKDQTQKSQVNHQIQSQSYFIDDLLNVDKLENIADLNEALSSFVVRDTNKTSSSKMNNSSYSNSPRCATPRSVHRQSQPPLQQHNSNCLLEVLLNKTGASASATSHTPMSPLVSKSRVSDYMSSNNQRYVSLLKSSSSNKSTANKLKDDAGIYASWSSKQSDFSPRVQSKLQNSSTLKNSIYVEQNDDYNGNNSNVSLVDQMASFIDELKDFIDDRLIDTTSQLELANERISSLYESITYLTNQFSNLKYQNEDLKNEILQRDLNYQIYMQQQHQQHQQSVLCYPNSTPKFTNYSSKNYTVLTANKQDQPGNNNNMYHPVPGTSQKRKNRFKKCSEIAANVNIIHNSQKQNGTNTKPARSSSQQTTSSASSSSSSSSSSSAASSAHSTNSESSIITQNVIQNFYFKNNPVLIQSNHVNHPEHQRNELNDRKRQIPNKLMQKNAEKQLQGDIRKQSQAVDYLGDSSSSINFYDNVFDSHGFKLNWPAPNAAPELDEDNLFYPTCSHVDLINSGVLMEPSVQYISTEIKHDDSYYSNHNLNMDSNTNGNSDGVGSVNNSSSSSGGNNQNKNQTFIINYYDDSNIINSNAELASTSNEEVDLNNSINRKSIKNNSTGKDKLREEIQNEETYDEDDDDDDVDDVVGEDVDEEEVIVAKKSQQQHQQQSSASSSSSSSSPPSCLINNVSVINEREHELKNSNIVHHLHASIPPYTNLIHDFDAQYSWDYTDNSIIEKI